MKKDFRLSETGEIHSRIESLLKERYAIGHVTIQFEFQRCDDQSLVGGR